MTLPAEQLTIALEAVAATCHVARAVQKDLENLRQLTKDDRSPVTVADFAVQAVVAMELRESLGELHIVGEENADELRADGQDSIRQAVLDAVRLHRHDASMDDVLDAIDLCNHDATSAHFWTLDPIDGTKGFLRGQQYAIALGLIEHGTVTLGVMGCPNLPIDQNRPLDEADTTGSLYGAIRGDGAREFAIDDPAGAGRIVQSGTNAPGQSIRTCGSVEKGHSRQSDTARILEHLGEAAAPVRLDSQCKYAVVARDQADAYFRMPTSATYVEKIWDHAAGSLIAGEAGAIVSDVTGSPLDFGRGWRLEANRGVICAVPGLHDRIIEAIGALDLAATAG